MHEPAQSNETNQQQSAILRRAFLRYILITHMGSRPLFVLLIYASICIYEANNDHGCRLVPQKAHH